MGKHQLIPLDKVKEIYARPDGWHYHLNKECPMLQGGDFERLGYVAITPREAKRRKLWSCLCAYKDFKPHQLIKGHTTLPKDVKLPNADKPS